MKQIELLLTDNVENLGIVGDVVKVRPGYARNYLLPYELATTPTKRNIERLAERRKQVEEQMRQLRGVQEALLEKLQDHEITIMRSANEQGVLFGSVSLHDIAELLREEGFAIEDRAVRIGQQIKRLDTYQIPIALTNDLKTEIKLWVVSDKPAEQLDSELAGEPQSEVQAEVEGEAPPQVQAEVDEG